MSARVLQTFVEADRGDGTGNRALKLDADLDRVGVVLRHGGRRIACVEQAGSRGRAGRVENHVDPVVAPLIAVRGKSAGAAVGEYAVSATTAAGRRYQRPISMSASKIVVVDRVEALIGMVGNDVNGVGGDPNRI